MCSGFVRLWAGGAGAGVGFPGYLRSWVHLRVDAGEFFDVMWIVK